MEAELARIESGLKLLRSLPVEQISDVSLSVKQHRYLLNPPLREDLVLQFEATHKIRLPPDYRAFLVHLGNGGAGPGYGVFKLGEVVMGWDSVTWQESGYVGRLAEPFPFTACCKDPNHPLWDIPFDGAIPISHYGCQTWAWLVITGPEAGAVWCDDRGDCIGVYPERRGVEDRMSFLDWYRWWVGQELGRVGGPDNTT
jgi:hypothetical protein